MNSEDISLLIDENCNFIFNPILTENLSFKTSIMLVKVQTPGKKTGKIFCECFGGHLYGYPKYYDLDHFSGNDDLIARCVSGNFSNTNNSLWDDRASIVKLSYGCSSAKNPIANYLFDNMIMRELCTYIAANITQYSLQDVESIGNIRERVLMHVYTTKQNKTVYVIKNVIYTGLFPIEWALNPETYDWEFEGKINHFIMGPGTSKNHCDNCNFYGSFHGVFIGYCSNCAKRYEFSRGKGFTSQGVEYNGEDGDMNETIGVSYLKGVELVSLGYHDATDDKYNNCLTGGTVPNGPDICDNQDDMDPVRENEIDEYNHDLTDAIESPWPSKRYPRRAYSNQHATLFNKVLIVNHSDVMTPDFIRHKLEIFFKVNNIKITDNNYSFPIGPRPEWDHYRITKQPYSWYAWNLSLETSSHYYHTIGLVEMRLYLSNVHSKDRPAVISLECNQVSGRSPLYRPMIRLLKSWILDEIEIENIQLSLPNHFQIPALQYPSHTTDLNH